MMVRIVRVNGHEAWLTCQHVLWHGNPDMEPALSDTKNKKGWVELIGLANQSEANGRIDNSYMYEGLAQVLIYEFGRMIHNKVINK